MTLYCSTFSCLYIKYQTWDLKKMSNLKTNRNINAAFGDNTTSTELFSCA